METNCIALSGVVSELKEIRRSPSGIAHRRLVLEHRSRQVEAGQPREVTVRIVVELRGNLALESEVWATPGVRLMVQGFLDRSGFRDDESVRLVLHAQDIKAVDRQ